MLQSLPAGPPCLGPAFRKAFRSLTATPRCRDTVLRSKLLAFFFNATLDLRRARSTHRSSAQSGFPVWAGSTL